MTNQNTLPTSGVCYPKGFRAAGVSAGLKSGSVLDLALVVNDGSKPASAGVFTSNRVVAAPVVYTRANMAKHTATHVILNAGNANACTGSQGAQDVVQTVNAVAQLSRIRPEQVAVCSTGIIGEYLDTDKLVAALPSLVSHVSELGGHDAAQAIMTTDTHPKEVAYDFNGWRVGGMAKGAGMLAPALATMLCVITTDAQVEPSLLQASLDRAVQRTFNRVDTDGCMSTNDTVIVLASGESGVQPSEADVAAGLEQACLDLARGLRKDAEGASHTIDIRVHGADSEAAAEAVGRAVARSNLVKTAIFGHDPNWGRILSQIGTVPAEVAPFDADKVDVAINGVTVCRGGAIGEPKDALDLASSKQVDVDIDLAFGDCAATIYTTDLTHDYVHENSAYST